MALLAILIIGAAGLLTVAGSTLILPSSKRVERTAHIKTAPAETYQKNSLQWYLSL